MSFVSYFFIAFVLILIILYYLVPRVFRCYVLLAASLFFYSLSGWQGMVFLCAAWLVTFFCGLFISALRGTLSSQKQKNDRKDAALVVLMTGLLLLIGMLLYAKIGNRLITGLGQVLEGEVITLSVIIPLGISYYTFAAIGYLADVYWKRDQVEKNPLKLLLYLCYFPQILQGPIPKHKTLAPKLSAGHRFDYERICFGMQRAVWGFFKKLVIADRLAIMVNQVFDNYLEYKGLIFVIGLVGAVFQLYTDFSGCMDIALGVSEIFGITLEENFRRPFFAVTAAEFWRRWHISLGTWFKDYVYMPLSTSPWLMEIGKFCRKHIGKTFARNLVTSIPLLMVWILTGLWHGTGLDYIVWGLYWGGIIILSLWCTPFFRKLNKRLGLTEDLRWWRVVRQVRTFGIYMVGRLLTLPGNLLTSRWIGRKIFTFNPWVLFDGTFFDLGWDYKDAWVALIALILLWWVSVQQEKGVRIRQKIASYPVVIRWAIYYGAVFAVLIFGMYGSGHSAGGFIYAQY